MIFLIEWYLESNLNFQQTNIPKVSPKIMLLGPIPKITFQNVFYSIKEFHVLGIIGKKVNLFC